MFGIIRLPNTRGFNMKTVFENTSGDYTQQGDYFLTNLTLQDEIEKKIGVRGIGHR